MKKNKIQFQHGQSLFSFFKLFGTTEQCEQALFEARPESALGADVRSATGHDRSQTLMSAALS